MKSGSAEGLFNSLSKKCDDAVVKVSQKRETYLLFSGNRLRVHEQLQSSETSAFVAMGKRKVMSVGKAISPVSLIKKCRSASPDEHYYGIAQGPFSHRKLKKEEAPNESLNIGFVRDVMSECREKGAGVSGGTILLKQTRNRLLSTGGARVSENQRRFYFSLRVLLDRGRSAHVRLCGRKAREISASRVAEEAVGIASTAKKKCRIRQGKYQTLFSPAAFAHIVSSFAPHFSATAVESGFSCLAGQEGKKIAADGFTLLDDPLHPDGFYSSTFDDEGRPTAKTELVKNGVFLTYMHNTSTAKHFNAKPTGHAGLLEPAPYNMVVKTGKRSLAEMLEEVKKGIYVTGLRYLVFNSHVAGEFSTLPMNAAFLVKNGEIEGSVEGIRISGRILEMLQNILIVGRKKENILGWEIPTPVLTPAVLVGNVQITKPTG